MFCYVFLRMLWILTLTMLPYHHHYHYPLLETSHHSHLWSLCSPVSGLVWFKIINSCDHNMCDVMCRVLQHWFTQYSLFSTNSLFLQALSYFKNLERLFKFFLTEFTTSFLHLSKVCLSDVCIIVYICQNYGILVMCLPLLNIFLVCCGHIIIFIWHIFHA